MSASYLRVYSDIFILPLSWSNFMNKPAITLRCMNPRNFESEVKYQSVIGTRIGVSL